MNVKKIRLVQFRNFIDLSVYFCSSVNIFIGDNAQGKTNLIESIYVLTKGNSYRTSEDHHLIQWNQNKSYILGEIQQKEQYFQVNILLQNTNSFPESSSKLKKIIKVNKKEQKKSWLLKKFNPVVFSPEDLRIIKNGPLLRRKFLDEVIIAMDPVYYQYLRDYQRILFQRNMLLKSGKNRDQINKQLGLWDQKMVEIATLIILFRIQYLQKLNQKAKNFHQMMTKNKENIKLKYQSNVLTNYTDKKDQIKDILAYKIKSAREKDLELRLSTIGPHRDDFFVISNHINLGLFGSQGQQRTAILSLKLAQLELFKEKENEYPPLLLDDVMSELDAERRNFLIQLIQKKTMQTFITSICLDDLGKPDSIKDAKIFRVTKGKVESR